MQSFNIVNTPVILLLSKKWAPGLSAEDNIYIFLVNMQEIPNLY